MESVLEDARWERSRRRLKKKGDSSACMLGDLLGEDETDISTFSEFRLLSLSTMSRSYSRTKNDANSRYTGMECRLHGPLVEKFERRLSELNNSTRTTTFFGLLSTNNILAATKVSVT